MLGTRVGTGFASLQRRPSDPTTRELMGAITRPLQHGSRPCDSSIVSPVNPDETFPDDFPAKTASRYAIHAAFSCTAGHRIWR